MGRCGLVGVDQAMSHAEAVASREVEEPLGSRQDAWAGLWHEAKEERMQVEY
jgi:hypothetical protein